MLRRFIPEPHVYVLKDDLNKFVHHNDINVYTVEIINTILQVV